MTSPPNRPSWVEYYMGLALMVARRSHDSQTKHGCIITDRQNRILSFGYNGFLRGIDDSVLPTTRPDKNPYMFHSERNALANCQLRPDNGIAYVTGKCCYLCLGALWQHGIKTVYMLDNIGGHTMNADPIEHVVFPQIIELTGLEVHFVQPDFTWMNEVTNDLYRYSPRDSN